MEVLQCPIDGQPCAADCPDRYRDQPEGGCWLTTACELGGRVLTLGDDVVAVVFGDDHLQVRERG